MQPHAGQPLVSAGVPLGQGTAVVIAVHGRGAGPANILDLVPRIGRDDLTWLAPAAADRTWYPYSFMAPREKNEPGLSSALDVLQSLVDEVVSGGVPHARLVLLGFSQGACLTAEFAARNPARYGGIIVLSGGLIGPPGTAWNLPGAFDGTPILLGSSDVDTHVPRTRVEETATVFETMGAAVDKRIYSGMGHVVNDDEIEAARTMLDSIR